MPTELIVSNLSDFVDLKNLLCTRWLEVMDIPAAFRYKLNIKGQKTINGSLTFVLQLNSERSTLRRKPQTITSIDQPFDENAFNFKQVRPCEILFDCIDQINVTAVHNNVTFLINNSPLTKYHSLICPNVSKNLPQILTMNSIRFVADLLMGFNDRNFRIGFNSLGAFASVNHLHFHLMWIEENLYVEKVQPVHVIGNIYKLDNDYPAIGLCLPLLSYEQKEEFSRDLYRIVEYFRSKSIPHNIFWTLCPNSHDAMLKVFIFPRDKLSDKHRSQFNVAFCELSGFVPVGNPEDYETLTEDMIIDSISNEMGHLNSDALMTNLRELFSS